MVHNCSVRNRDVPVVAGIRALGRGRDREDQGSWAARWANLSPFSRVVLSLDLRRGRSAAVFPHRVGKYMCPTGSVGASMGRMLEAQAIESKCVSSKGSEKGGGGSRVLVGV